MSGDSAESLHDSHLTRYGDSSFGSVTQSLGEDGECGHVCVRGEEQEVLIEKGVKLSDVNIENRSLPCGGIRIMNS